VLCSLWRNLHDEVGVQGGGHPVQEKMLLGTRPGGLTRPGPEQANGEPPAAEADDARGCRLPTPPPNLSPIGPSEGRSFRTRCQNCCHDRRHGVSEVPEADKWPVQVSAAFGFVEQLGFRVIDGGSYRLGNWTLFGNGPIGIHLDCDGDTRSLAVKLVRLENGHMPDRWWYRQVPRVTLSLREIAELLAPQSLTGEASLPPIEREADRAPHLRFWASVLQAVAADWKHLDGAWYDRVEARLRA